MAYKYSVGLRDFGDIDYEGDDNTQIDFDVDYVALVTNGISMLTISGSSVGIGTAAPDPDELLTIDGADGNHEANIQFREGGANRAKIGVNDSDNLVLHNQATNKHIVLKVNDQGVTREGLRVDGAVPEVVVNEGSESLVDFRVESDNNTHMLFVDGGNDKVGIGTGTPIAELDVAGKIAITTEVSTPSQPSDGQGYIYSKSDGKLYWRSHDQSETDLTATGGASSIVTNMTHHRYNDGSGTGLEYIPWAGTSEQNSPSWITQGVAAYAGKLAKVLVRSSKSGGMGSTAVGIHANVDGNTVINSTPEETQTVNMTTANTTYTFTFSNANHFGPGDVIGVSIDPTNAHGNVNVTCVWEYDTSA